MVVVPDRRPGGRGHRQRLQVGGGRRHGGSAQSGHSGGHRSIHADLHGQGGEQLGHVGGQLAVGGAEFGHDQSGQPGPIRAVDGDVAGAELAVGEAMLVKAGHALPQIGQRGVA